MMAWSSEQYFLQLEQSPAEASLSGKPSHNGMQGGEETKPLAQSSSGGVIEAV